MVEAGCTRRASVAEATWRAAEVFVCGLYVHFRGCMKKLFCSCALVSPACMGIHLVSAGWVWWGE